MDYRILGVGLLLAVVVASGCIDGGEEVDPGEEIETEPEPEPEPEPDEEQEPIPEDGGETNDPTTDEEF